MLKTKLYPVRFLKSVDLLRPLTLGQHFKLYVFQFCNRLDFRGK